MIDSFRLAMLYMAFAIVATLCNILTQDICSYLYSGDFSILISIIIGTGFGLVVKYILDKKYIFQYKTNRYTMITGIEILSSSTGRKISSFQIFAVVDCGSRSKLGHIFDFTAFSLSAEELINRLCGFDPPLIQSF